MGCFQNISTIKSGDLLLGTEDSGKSQPAPLRHTHCAHVLQVFTEYFKVLEEESIRDNFVTVYELLDEVMDFGFPQTTDSKILLE